VADAYLQARAELDPEAAAALGRTPTVRLPRLAPGDFAERAALDKRTVAALDAAPDDDHLLAAAMRERLSSDIALDEVGFTRRLLAPLATPVHLVRQVFDGLPLADADDGEVLLANLEAVPQTLADYLATLTESARSGQTAAARQVLAVADQCDAWVRDGFYPGLVAGLPSSVRVVGLDRAADRAALATADLADALRTLVPGAPRADAVGRDVYQVTSSAFLGTRVDLDELYAWGWELLRDLRAQAREVAAEIVGEPDVAAAVRALDADPARRVPVGEPLRAWLQGRLDAVTDAVDGRWFDLPSATRAVEARMSAAASGVMYYTPPDAGLTRPGRVWWTVPAGQESVATWREVSTVHHEGVPGHHLQHAITFGLTGLHPWQRLLCQVHGYAEGWAHHSEQLAVDLGLVPDPGDRLGVVFARLWRACRVVVDLGLHLDLPIPAANGVVEADRWTPGLGVDVLRTVAEVDPDTARFEVDRYLGWPGQALAFTVGARLWREACVDAETRAAGAFDLREFHGTALGLGPMGLGPLRAALSGAFTGQGVRRAG
jgi:uncharacterized protein (DUF885 family)